MRSNFAKTAAVFALPLALFFTQKSQAQNTVKGWDVPANSEFVVRNVKMIVQGKWITRDVHCDCDLLVKGKTNTGADAVFPTPAFYAQFNAESSATWDALPDNVKKDLGKSRYNRSVSRTGIDATKAHLINSHGLPESVPNKAAKKCKSEHYGL